jgi:hypothetical protein
MGYINRPQYPNYDRLVKGWYPNQHMAIELWSRMALGLSCSGHFLEIEFLNLSIAVWR